MKNKIGSGKHLHVRVALVLVAAFATLSAAAMPVAAATGSATDWVGACHMVLAGTGMFDIAMTHDNPLGNTGMFTAVYASGCNP